MTRTIALLDTPGQKWYAQYLRSTRWRVLRAVALWLAGGECRMCKANAREVHHRSYTHCGRGGLFGMVRELRDLTALCHACHEHFHMSDVDRKR